MRFTRWNYHKTCLNPSITDMVLCFGKAELNWNLQFLIIFFSRNNAFGNKTYIFGYSYGVQCLEDHCISPIEKNYKFSQKLSHCCHLWHIFWNIFHSVMRCIYWLHTQIPINFEMTSYQWQYFYLAHNLMNIFTIYVLLHFLNIHFAIFHYCHCYITKNVSLWYFVIN